MPCKPRRLNEGVDVLVAGNACSCSSAGRSAFCRGQDQGLSHSSTDLKHEAEARVKLGALAHGLNAPEVCVHVEGLLRRRLLLLLPVVPSSRRSGRLWIQVCAHCPEKLR